MLHLLCARSGELYVNGHKTNTKLEKKTNLIKIQ